MKKYFLIVWIFLTVSTFAYELKSFKNNGIDYVWDEKELYEPALDIYLQAFRKLYTELSVEGSEEHFKETMRHELELGFQHPDQIHWLIAKKEGRLVGLSIVEFFNYPSVYIREMAVIPEYQRQGIGRQLTFSVLRDLPEITKIQIVTRKINQPAIDFYKVLGFEISDFCHSEYDPNRYIGMEWFQK